ncbi:FCD domain-containing protein [Limibaculum sp. M0105]|uniref:Pyruvate dehydrogenase complex repressor n=1 Tax=Thermohalobaculum xanthum TaxID=2753746 RepID=A0A8J7M7T3_9RHOB|nr:FCD domain-containing protein [Thermohalobaculum xanthum]MBK0399300.1 FCD domain-containing protein [Thermohalobaculum xanthum]
MPFRPISADRISSAIVRQIEELILQGVLRPGDRLPAERELAEQLDVSRPTLREALAELDERGLVVARPGGGTFIADVLGSAFAPPLIELFATHDTALFDYIAFRRDLEGLAAERAAVHATEADLATIASVFRRMEEAAGKRNPDEAAALDAEFHMSVVEAAHNVVMLHMMRSLYALLVQGVFYNRNIVYGVRKGRDMLLEQHRAIRDAVLARNPRAARRAVEEHMDYVAAALHEADRMRTREEIAALRHRHEQLRATKPRKARQNGNTA